MSQSGATGIIQMLNNVSIVHRVSLGFGLLVLMIILNGALSLRSSQSFTTQLHKVTEEATPLVLQSSQMAVDLLSADKHFKDAITIQNMDVIAESSQKFADSQQAFNASIKTLGGMTQENKQLRRLLSELGQLDNDYFAVAKQVVEDNRHYLEQQHEVKRMSGQLTLILPKLKEQLNDKVVTLNSNFVRWTADSFFKALADIERNTFEALSDNNLSSIEAILQRNKSLLKDLNAAAGDLEAKVPEIRSEMGGMIQQLTRDASQDDGLLVLHLSQIRLQQSIAQRTAETAEVISVAVQALDKVNQVANRDVEQAKTTAMTILESSQTQALTLMALALPLAFLVAWSVAKAIKTPLGLLLNALKAAAEGNLTAIVDYQSANEFGRLAESANSMMTQMRAVLNEIKEASENLASVSSSNAATLNHSKEELNHQRQETASVAVAMTEMEQSVKEVSNSAEVTLDKVIEVEAAANVGREVMSNNITTTHQLSDKVEHSSEVISEVGNMSNNIGSILDVIRGIADQTNLLALNAAIEAARAGEQGRGFAVVADEVRVLAQKTTNSTSEIQSMIENLQKGAQRAVKVMSECSGEMQASIAQASDANGAMEEIQGIITQISDMSSQIAAAAAEQQATGAEISTNLNRITDISDENYTSIEQVTQTSEEMGELAAQQDALVKRFEL